MNGDFDDGLKTLLLIGHWTAPESIELWKIQIN